MNFFFSLEAFDIMGQFGGSLGEQAGLLNLARQGFDIVTAGAEKFSGTFREGVDRLKEGVAGFKEYLANLGKAKKVQQEAADAAFTAVCINCKSLTVPLVASLNLDNKLGSFNLS